MNNASTKLKGRVERAAGELKDDDHLKREGEIDKANANVKDRLDNAVEKVKDALHRGE